jgi:hypothetical protein
VGDAKIQEIEGTENKGGKLFDKDFKKSTHFIRTLENRNGWIVCLMGAV